MVNKQDSNVTSCSLCEEASVGVLPAAASQYWMRVDPNSYPEFGDDIKKVARKTLNPTRKVKKGGVVDVDGMAGFAHDFMLEGLLRPMRGFFFTDGDESGTSDPLNLALRRTLTAAASDDSFTLSAAMTGTISVGDLVFTDGFVESANNGLHYVSAATTTKVTTTSVLADEAGPAAARLRAVGHRFGSGNLTATVSGDYLILADSASGFTSLNINVGDTIFIGGDATANQFATLGTGYARVVTVAAGLLLLKDFTGTPAADTGTGKTIDIYTAVVGFRDEPMAADIVRRTYTIERTLGEDDNGPQAEYVKGAVPDQLNFELPEADKVTVTMSYKGQSRYTIDGTGTLLTEDGSAHVEEPPTEDFVNTSTDVYVARLVADVGQESLVGYLENISFAVSNGVQGNKAVGVTGSFDFSAGDFSVTGSANAYFNTVAVMDAIADNDDVSVQIIGARDNEGFAFAMPLVTLSGGQADVAADEPIMLPVEIMAAAGVSNVTLSYCYFAYLPTVAMPA